MLWRILRLILWIGKIVMTFFLLLNPCFFVFLFFKWSAPFLCINVYLLIFIVLRFGLDAYAYVMMGNDNESLIIPLQRADLLYRRTGRFFCFFFLSESWRLIMGLFVFKKGWHCICCNQSFLGISIVKKSFRY